MEKNTNKIWKRGCWTPKNLIAEKTCTKVKIMSLLPAISHWEKPLFILPCNKTINKIHPNFKAKNLENGKNKTKKLTQLICHHALKILKTKKNSVSSLLAFKTICTNSHLLMMTSGCRTCWTRQWHTIHLWRICKV